MTKEVRRTAYPVTITLRMPASLHSRLERSAQKASSSLNSEIVGRLLGSYRRKQKLLEQQELMTVIQTSMDERVAAVVAAELAKAMEPVIDRLDKWRDEDE